MDTGTVTEGLSSMDKIIWKVHIELGAMLAIYIDIYTYQRRWKWREMVGCTWIDQR